MVLFSAMPNFQTKQKKYILNWYKMVQKWLKGSPNMVPQVANLVQNVP